MELKLNNLLNYNPWLTNLIEHNFDCLWYFIYYNFHPIEAIQ